MSRDARGRFLSGPDPDRHTFTRGEQRAGYWSAMRGPHRAWLRRRIDQLYPRSSRTWTAGALAYRAAMMERARSAGAELDLHQVRGAELDLDQVPGSEADGAGRRSMSGCHG